MQLHSDKIKTENIWTAARIARVDVETVPSGSRIRNHKHTVHLEGESRRRPNRRGMSNGYAATWDQWGVFLAVLFSIDPDMVCGSGLKYATYRNAEDFHHQTNWRFEKRRVINLKWEREWIYWPPDAHGDHRFQFSGIVGQQECTKCTAVRRWRRADDMAVSA